MSILYDNLFSPIKDMDVGGNELTKLNVSLLTSQYGLPDQLKALGFNTTSSIGNYLTTEDATRLIDLIQTVYSKLSNTVAISPPTEPSIIAAKRPSSPIVSPSNNPSIIRPRPPSSPKVSPSNNPSIIRPRPPSSSIVSPSNNPSIIRPKPPSSPIASPSNNPSIIRPKPPSSPIASSSSNESLTINQGSDLTKPNQSEELKYSKSIADDRRERIRNQIATKWNINLNQTNLTSNILVNMYQLYDTYFFRHLLSNLLRSTNSTVTFDFNKRLTRTIGRCSRRGCSYTIQFSPGSINQIANSSITRNAQLGGVSCSSYLMCLQLTMEHELIHLLMNLKKVNETAHGPTFKRHIYNIFGQTDIKHISYIEEEENEFTREQAKVGMAVKFQVKGQDKEGVIFKLNPVNAKVRDTLFKEWSVKYRALSPIDRNLSYLLQSQVARRVEPSTRSNVFLTRENTFINQRVYFSHRNKTLIGVIIKRNPTRAKVELENGRIFNVPYSILSPST